MKRRGRGAAAPPPPPPPPQPPSRVFLAALEAQRARAAASSAPVEPPRPPPRPPAAGMVYAPDTDRYFKLGRGAPPAFVAQLRRQREAAATTALGPAAGTAVDPAFDDGPPSTAAALARREVGGGVPRVPAAWRAALLRARVRHWGERAVHAHALHSGRIVGSLAAAPLSHCNALAFHAASETVVGAGGGSALQLLQWRHEPRGEWAEEEGDDGGGGGELDEVGGDGVVRASRGELHYHDGDAVDEAAAAITSCSDCRRRREGAGPSAAASRCDCRHRAGLRAGPRAAAAAAAPTRGGAPPRGIWAAVRGGVHHVDVGSPLLTPHAGPMTSLGVSPLADAQRLLVATTSLGAAGRPGRVAVHSIRLLGGARGVAAATATAPHRGITRGGGGSSGWPPPPSTSVSAALARGGSAWAAAWLGDDALAVGASAGSPSFLARLRPDGRLRVDATIVHGGDATSDVFAFGAALLGSPADAAGAATHALLVGRRNGDVLLWDARSGRMGGSGSGGGGRQTGSASRVARVDASVLLLQCVGSSLALVADAGTTLQTRDVRQLSVPLASGAGYVNSVKRGGVRVSADGALVGAACADGRVRVWDARTLRLLHASASSRGDPARAGGVGGGGGGGSGGGGGGGGASSGCGGGGGGSGADARPVDVCFVHSADGSGRELHAIASAAAGGGDAADGDGEAGVLGVATSMPLADVELARGGVVARWPPARGGGGGCWPALLALDSAGRLALLA